MLSLFFLLLHLSCFFLSSSKLFSISFSFLLFLPVALLLLLYVFSSSLFLFIRVFLLLSKVSWCSWLSHHFYVVRVPGSNPGGTIFIVLLCCFICFFIFFYVLDYVFLFFISVGSYQVGYTRSHPNTEVKMLRACSVPLCSHRWERQVIYLFVFFLTQIYS